MKVYTKISLGVVSLATSVLLVGCGSSDSSTTTTGYFIDSAVEGISYTTSSGLAGTTDAEGRFKYKPNDSVAFNIGKLSLGASNPDNKGLVTPKYLVAGEPTQVTLTTEQEQKLTLVLQTLQSLDSDNNTSNGITIDSSVVSSLDDLNVTFNLQDLNESEIVDIDSNVANVIDKDYNGKMDVNATEALSHFNESVQTWEQEHTTTTNNENTHGNGRGQGNGQGNGNGGENGHTQTSNGTFDLNDYPVTSELSDTLKNSLAYMGNEERLAYDIYMNLYNYNIINNNLEIKQFYNIATRAETQHIAIVRDIITRYAITSNDVDVNETTVEDNNLSSSVPQEELPSGVYDIDSIQMLYNNLYDLGIQGQEESLKVGCMVEVTDINDLDGYLQTAEDSNATDIVAGFEVLRDGSYNHYWAFDKALKNIGVTNGCYYEGDTLLTNKDGLYPQN